MRRKTERLRAVDFSIMKNLTASVGSEPAIFIFLPKFRPFRVLFVQVSFLCPIVLRAVDFSIMKNPTASVGSEPTILGTRGQHVNP
jgi:hypothetical protein